MWAVIRNHIYNNFIVKISIILLSSHCVLANNTGKCDRGAVCPVYMTCTKDMTQGQKYYTLKCKMNLRKD